MMTWCDAGERYLCRRLSGLLFSSARLCQCPEGTCLFARDNRASKQAMIDAALKDK